MVKNKKEGKGVLAVCLIIIVILICLVGIFDFMIYGELKREKEGLTFKKNEMDILIQPTGNTNNNIVTVDNSLCMNDNCTSDVTLGKYKLEYKENNLYINGNIINPELKVISISTINNDDNYLLIKVTKDTNYDYVIYNGTTNTVK